MKMIVAKKAVRQFIREMLDNPAPMGWKKAEEDQQLPTSVSDIVDPSEAITNPGNPNFKPRNRVELTTALSSIVQDISDDDASKIYDSLKDSIADLKDDSEEKKMKNNEDKKVEEAIRKTIRKLLDEAAGAHTDTGLSYSGVAYGSDGDVDMAEKIVSMAMKSFDVLDIKDKPEEFLKLLVSKLTRFTGDRLATIKSAIEVVEEIDPEAAMALDETLTANPGIVPKRNVTMSDVGGASIPAIAQELGLKSHGKLQEFIDNALKKARYLIEMDPDEKQILFLTAMNEYIRDFSAAGDLTAADVQLMKDHPEMVMELDTFRVYFDKYLKKTLRSGQKVMNPLEGD